MIDFTLKLKNKNALLRPMKRDDLKAFAALTGTPSMWVYFTEDLSVPSTLEQWVYNAVAQMENQTRLAFTAVERSSGNIMGSTSIGNISYRDQRAEIGWTWLGKDYQGRGINSQMKHLIFQYLFDDIGFQRVECKTDVLNLPARKSLAGIGMVEEGILRSHTQMTHNRRRDTIYYSVLKDEWEDVKRRISWE